MAFHGRGRDGYWSDNHAASSGQYDGCLPPPERSITRHPQCNVAEIPDDWLQGFKHSWNVFKASENVKRVLCNYLSLCQNPYASALQIMSECNDFYHSKAKSMASFVIETFATWIAPQEQAYRDCLTKELKNEAFKLVTQQKNIALTRLVFKTFHLTDNATDYLAQIRFMADCKMYKEACQCASLLNLTKYFTLEELVLPLVLQDKHAVAEEALVQVPEMQKELVAFLDNLLGRRNLAAEIDNLLLKLDVPDVKFEVVYHPKPLGKLIARLIKKFELPQDLAPNLNKKRTGGALQFLIRKRYKDNLNSDSWNEMVKEAVGDDPQLQLELVCTVNNYGDNHEALYWAHYFKIPKEQWPYNVRLLDREDPEAKYCQPKTAAEDDDGSEENWGSEDVAFLQLSLPDSALVMIDTEDALHGLIDIFTHAGVTVAGMDSEWKPAFAGRQSELALVQVATREQVFIIDLVRLAGRAPDVWNQLGNCLFRNKDILKLGFDIVNDLQMIKAALPEMGQIKQNGHGYLDLSLLWKRLTNSHLILPYRDASKNSTSESLSQLVFLTMGRGLNKANQFSNWEQRPLRIGQLRYAALDAFCLLDVYEILKQCCEEQNIPFFEICDEIMLNYKGPRKSSNSNAAKKKPPINDLTETTELPWPHFPETAAGQRPLVLPADLRGVARFLRSMGVDVGILECPGSDIVAQARAAVTAGRRVACKGRNYRQLSALVPLGYCYNVKSLRTSDQATEILSAFNIVVSHNDIFSRCQACNSNEFLKISRETAKLLHKMRTGGSHTDVEEATCSTDLPDDNSKDYNPATHGVEIDGSTSAAYRAWTLIDEPPQLKSDCKTSRGVVIQIEQVPADLLHLYEHLYVCDLCGKCFWEGSHLKRFVNSTRCVDVLHRREADAVN